MTHSLAYFISLDQVPLKKMNMAKLYGGIGVVNGGGTCSCTFAEDVNASYLDWPPTSIFASFVDLEHLWQICSQICLLFCLLFITIT